jgi:hypothetical protein
MGAVADRTRAQYRRDMNRSLSKWRFLVPVVVIAAGIVLMIGWVDASLACREMPTRWAPGKTCELVKVLYDWQQLVGALVALGAAVIGWLAITRQMRQAEDQEKERLRRKHDAARAMLPLALSSISEYTQECTNALKAIYRTRQGKLIPKRDEKWEPPAVPIEATGDLRSMVEASPPSQGKATARLLSRIQVQASRLRTLAHDLLPNDETSVMARNIEQYLVDTIEIAALTNSAYNFARGADEHLPTEEPTLAGMFNASMGLGIHHGFYPEVEEIIESQYGASK